MWNNVSLHKIATKTNFSLAKSAKNKRLAEYNAAIAPGETAALLEQDKADVFTQLIGNVRPHSRVNIRITYVADLKVEIDGAVRFVLPLLLLHGTPLMVRALLLLKLCFLYLLSKALYSKITVQFLGEETGAKCASVAEFSTTKTMVHGASVEL